MTTTDAAETHTPEELPGVVTKLYKGVVYAESDEKIWQSLLGLSSHVRDYVAVLGLDLILDESEGYAFLKSREDPDGTLPRLIPRRPLTFNVSLLLALLRGRMLEFDTNSSELRLIMTEQDIADMPVTKVLITENLVNFLALPDGQDTLAIYGGGYGFSSLRDAGWLRNCEVLYWGDLDTHGFRILDQLRAVHPHVMSVMMDEATLLAHRDAWVTEPSPSKASLSRLTPDESALYEGLRNDAFGTTVRLEQELIRWDWALGRLAG